MSRQQGGALLRRELVGDRPPRRPRGDTEPGALRGVVELDDDTVDLVVEVVAALLPVQTVGGDLVDRGEGLHVFVDGEAEGGGELEHRDVAREVRAPDHLAELVAEEGQIAAGRHGRILLTKAARCRVARVDEGLLPRCDGALVELLEARPGHVHLAAHLDHLGGSVGEDVWHVADRGDVRGDVLADPSVATGRGLHEPSVLVAQADGETVELQLAHERRLVTVEALGHTVRPRTQLIGVHRVVETHHRYPMGDRRERGADRAADEPGRRVVGDEIGMVGFELAQLAYERVVVRVADLGVVERVVPLVVIGDLGPELVDAHRRGGRVVRMRCHRGPRLRRVHHPSVTYTMCLAHRVRQAPSAKRVAADWSWTRLPTSAVSRTIRRATDAECIAKPQCGVTML